MMMRLKAAARTSSLLAFLLALILTACSEEPHVVAEMDVETERLLRMGSSALQQHEFAAALAIVDSAGRMDPESPHVAFLRARVLSELGRFDEADKAYQRVLSLDSRYRGTYANLGNNAYRRQAYREAIDFYRKELALNPEAIPFRALGKAWVELGEQDSAAVAFRRAVAIDSNYAAAWFNLAQLLEDEGDFDQASQAANHAWRNGSDNPEFEYQHAALLVKRGKYQQALPHLRSVAKVWPWHHGSHYNLGQAFSRMRQADSARLYLDKAEKVRAVSAKIEHLENTVRSLPDDPMAHASLAMLYRRVGRYNDAMHAYKVANYLQPGNTEISTNIANLHLVRGDTSQAIEAYQQILMRNPRDINTRLNLGVVHVMRGQVHEARRAWEAVLRMAPGHPAANAYLKKLNQQLAKAQ